MTRREPESTTPEMTDFASRVLDVAESIPAGRVMSYGDIAEYLGDGGPRQVGRVMALWGGGVPWWRVVHSDGTFLAGHEREAVRRYHNEGTPLRTDSDGRPVRLNMRLARWSGLAETAEGQLLPWAERRKSLRRRHVASALSVSSAEIP